MRLLSLEDIFNVFFILFKLFLKTFDLLIFVIQTGAQCRTLLLFVDKVTDAFTACEHLEWRNLIVDVHLSKDIAQCLTVALDKRFIARHFCHEIIMLLLTHVDARLDRRDLSIQLVDRILQGCRYSPETFSLLLIALHLLVVRIDLRIIITRKYRRTKLHDTCTCHEHNRRYGRRSGGK